jgi:hypothetical protein
MSRPIPSRDDALAAGLTAGGVAFEVALAASDGGAAALPEWVQLTPRGAVQARDGRRFVFDPERLAAAFTAGGLKLPIDFEHEAEYTMLLGARPARGWIIAVEARADGLFGQIEWLPDAVTALTAKSYRYISPTFWRDADGVSARLLKGAALVASPALGMPAVASSTPDEQDLTMIKDVLAALGLPETATAADATAAIATLKAGDPDRHVPKAQHDATVAALATAQATIEATTQAAEAARCGALIDDAVKAGKVTPAARDHYLALAKANFDATAAAIAAMPVVVPAGEDKQVRGGRATSSDAITLGARARQYMDEQAAKGITVSAAEAVAHIEGGAA